jgi:hypothetical protein
MSNGSVDKIVRSFVIRYLMFILIIFIVWNSIQFNVIIIYMNKRYTFYFYIILY